MGLRLILPFEVILPVISVPLFHFRSVVPTRTLFRFFFQRRPWRYRRQHRFDVPFKFTCLCQLAGSQGSSPFYLVTVSGVSFLFLLPLSLLHLQQVWLAMDIVETPSHLTSSLPLVTSIAQGKLALHRTLLAFPSLTYRRLIKTCFGLPTVTSSSSLSTLITRRGNRATAGGITAANLSPIWC